MQEKKSFGRYKLGDVEVNEECGEQ